MPPRAINNQKQAKIYSERKNTKKKIKETKTPENIKQNYKIEMKRSYYTIQCKWNQKLKPAICPQ